jgi:hypothetical protein
MTDSGDTESSPSDSLQELHERLNRDFYTADPADYFHVRWLSLMLLAGRPHAALALFRDGISYGHIFARLEDPEVDPDGVRDFATMESQVLFHQACETLLRLYLARVKLPPCPWLEMAATTSFASFKARVRKEVIEGRLEEDVEQVFLGGTRRNFEGLTQSDWEQVVRTLARFLRTFAGRWLEDAHAYNSLKHGLAVLPSEVQLSFAQEGTEIGDAQLLAHGPSLDFLECTPWSQDGRRSWQRTTTWIDVSEALAFVDVARNMIVSLWEVARARYSTASGSAKIFVPRDLEPSMLRSAGRSPGLRWTVSLGMEEVRGR